MRYDVIVVGARCAGSPTAMLLARRGHKVLLVDRATFPSDTISTHILQPPGVAALARWGLLDRLLATGCPPIDTYAFDFGPVTITGSPGTAEHPASYCPRRTVLDKILVDAAAEAGAEVREAFTVTGIVTDDGRVTGIRGRDRAGATVTEHARVVVGADGVHSMVAKAVLPGRYHEKPELIATYYAYFSDLPMAGRFEMYGRPERGFCAAPTHDGLTIVVGGWPHAQLEANRADIEGTLLAALDLAPPFADRVRSATRETRFVGMSVPNFFRVPSGPGWALVGDAGYTRDPITAQGISDAFREAESCAEALHDHLSGTTPYADAMADYQSSRDEQVLPIYEFTTQLATLEPPPPDLQRLLDAMPGNQEAMDGFARVNSGVTSPADFFSAANVDSILAGATP
ncbi:FAD-dependent oxidoreductase [Longispora fulva]|uniref:2-polyprenyl-6-methoxyphenol hydroxylase-like FAD-dependent oxidoreductase n=1 Tax=Longispora fulva TaxID=619741 RepID=A0A8J7GKW2_9ACTN|nr:NAD(P)/FAD-dependent oxidoreductase [Longispora fulva]MBG6138742.1 2-polyprenyl-6-methoxyphenol hydroxylase-like FAD-dependent oxidoreductase [Longispora fulva]GIG58236.1 FAD-dependent oxidoreductase [Longispora fulva]